MKEIESQKRRIISSREDGKLEVLTELENTKQQLIVSEDKTRSLSGELKKLREDYVTISSRLTSTLQQIQVYESENETLKLAHSSVLNDSTAANQALVHATQRIAAMDIDISNFRAEILLLRRENDELLSSKRKLSSSSSISSDRLNTAELELKRVKQQSSTEINRLNARMIELESINQQQYVSLENASNQDSDNVRTLQRNISKLEHKNNLLQENINDRDNQIAKSSVRILNYEKHIQSLEESVYKKDRALHECETSINQLNEKFDAVKISLENEINKSIQSKREFADDIKDLENKHKVEIAKIQQEVTEKLPKIVSLSLQQVDAKWANKLAVGKQVGSVLLFMLHALSIRSQAI